MKSRRGFAAMSKEQQRTLASRGGKTAHAKGTAHEFSSEEGKIAGRKGGAKVAQDRAHMSEIGRKGGLRRGEGLARKSGKNPAHAAPYGGLHDA